MRSDGRICRGKEAQFIEMMNEKARELDAVTRILPMQAGLPDSDHYTTALRSGKIMRAGLQNPLFPKGYQRSQLYDSGHKPQQGARGMHNHMPLMAKESNLLL